MTTTNRCQQWTHTPVSPTGQIGFYASLLQLGRFVVALLTVFSRQPRTLSIVLAGLALIAISPLFSPATAAIIDQPMTESTAPGWVIGGSAYLSASTGVDTPGNGWLRLTEPYNDQAGFAMYDSAFDISNGVIIQFDYATWGGAGDPDGGGPWPVTGADGYSIYLFDATYNASTFQVGASGGSLGYDKKTVAPVSPGLSGGYIGVGIDEWGNFSAPSEGRSGGPGQRYNSVAVRGPYDHPTAPYYYLGGTAANIAQLAFPGVAVRPGQSNSDYRKVVVYLTPVAAPNYLRVDVYLQTGYGQPLTQIINTLYTGRPIPSNVKVGYAASTGGATNYHEIRNLTIDNLPTNVNLAITKSVSAPTVVPGGALTYTVTARNYGPSLPMVNNIPIVDTLPVQLTGVTWTCAASGGGNCDALSGSGNLNTTADLPFNGAVTYTITGTVSGGTPLGTVINNTATLSAPSGVTDYQPDDNSASVATTVSNGTITISGTVYNDSGAGGGIAHNGVRDGSEAGVNAALTYYAKLFRTSDLTATIVAPVTVNTTTGAYSFTGVPSFGDYVVILSSTNTANVYDPSFPSANWIYVSPLNYTLSGVVANGANLTNQNFFVYNGSRISGKVIKDDGFNGSISTAYDGILNAAETGIPGVTVRLANNTGVTTYDTTVTDANGTFVLFTTTASANLRIYETNLPAYTSVSWNDGTTNGTYTIGGEYIQFAYTLYTDYNNILFGDIPPPVTISFTPTPQNGIGTPAVPVYYPHIFTATARGSVTFSTNSRTQGTWPVISYVRDLDCDGSFDGGEPDIVAAISLEAATDLCILVRETIPVGAVPGTIDTIVTRATFTTGLASQSADDTDTTTVANYPSLTVTKNWVDLNNGDHEPNDTIRYTITLTETNNIAANNVSVTDTIDTNYDTFAVVSIPSGAVDSSTIGTGPLNITGISILAGGSVSIVYTVKIVNGTAAGTSIPNIANFVNPGGANGSAVATNVIVSASALPGSGNKPLYFYDASTTPVRKLSRTPMTVTPASFVPVPRNTTLTWTEFPALELPVTISSGTIPVQLWLSTDSTRTYNNVPVTLLCGASTVATATQNLALTNGAAPALFTYNLNLFANYTCAAGSAWGISIRNTQGAGTGRNIRVYPAPAAGSYSNVTLPSQDVINVDSVIPYSGNYPDITSPASYAAGTTVHLRAVVSDPFGSYDINVNNDATTLPRITITDSADNSTTVTNATMTEVADSGGATKTFEFDYLIPAGPAGYWTVSVTAPEGTEGTVSDVGVASFQVTTPMPNLVVLKSASAYSDPINGIGAGAKAIPGAFMNYSITVTNFGPGAVDNNTTVITDPIPANTELFVGDYDGVGPATGPILFTNGTTASGLNYTFTSLASTTDNLAFSGNNGTDYDKNNTTPDSNECDPTVTNIRIPLSGPFNGSDGTNHPSFNIKFRVRIK